MIGHEKIVADLKRLADTNALSHGYIFFGPTMIGKKLAAQGLADYLEHGSFEEGTVLLDTMVVEPGENGSIGIDVAREVKNFLWQKPRPASPERNAQPRRIVIINDADRLTTEAQNALLKITEEPPASSLIILVTADLESILPTITSRLASMHFGLVREGEIGKWLIAEGKAAGATEKKTALTKTKAEELSRKAFGKPGLAMRLWRDETFQGQIALAEKFLKSAKATRRDLIKKIIEPDDFDLRAFLDAVIMVMAWEGARKKNAAQWHKALALYGRQAEFSLNPRLQLEALLL